MRLNPYHSVVSPARNYQSNLFFGRWSPPNIEPQGKIARTVIAYTEESAQQPAFSFPQEIPLTKREVSLSLY